MGTKSILIDITGQRFSGSKLTPVKYIGDGLWECICDCGNTCIAKGKELRNGKRKSCGCLKIENAIKIGKNNTIHGGCIGGKRTRLYNIWRQMNARCYSPKSSSWRYYGDKGVRVCDDWKIGSPEGFINFKNWSLQNGYQDGLTIDRQDSSGNYEPSNCRWETMTVQNRNRGDYNQLLEYNGEIKCLSEWAKLFEIKNATLYDRIFKHYWTVKRALEEPVHSNGRKESSESQQESSQVEEKPASEKISNYKGMTLEQLKNVAEQLGATCKHYDDPKIYRMRLVMAIKAKRGE